MHVPPCPLPCIQRFGACPECPRGHALCRMPPTLQPLFTKHHQKDHFHFVIVEEENYSKCDR